MYIKFWEREKHFLICVSRNEDNLSTKQEVTFAFLASFTVSNGTRNWGWSGADTIPFLVMKCSNLGSLQAC